MIDVIIPTIPGREESLHRAVQSYEEVGGADCSIIVVESKTAGWGWRIGLQHSDAEYVLLGTDDHECLSDLLSGVEAIDEGFITCPRVWTPHGLLESQGGDMSAPHHITRSPQPDWAKVDYTTVPFLSREHMDRIGMIDTQYCCDVWVSYRARQLGIETVLRHGFDIGHHQHQVGRGAGMPQHERDAMDRKTMEKELAQYRVGQPA